MVCWGPHQGLRDTDWQNCTGDSTGTWIVLLSPCSPKERQDGERKKEIKTGGSAHYYFCSLSCWCTAYCPEVRNTVHMLISHWNCLCTRTDGSLWGDWTDAVAAMFRRWNGLGKSMSTRAFCCCCCCSNTQLLSWTAQQVCTQTAMTTTMERFNATIHYFCTISFL